MNKTELEKRLEEEMRKEENAKTVKLEIADENDANEVGGGEQAADIESIENGEEGDGQPIQQALATLAEERDSFKDQLLRTRAEFDNYRKRTAREAEQNRARAAESLIADLLPVVDHLELALQHSHDDSGGFVEGVQMVLKQLLDTLARHGVEPIESVGQPFDPNIHEAMAKMESNEHPDDFVAQEYQKGYLLGNRILRPAKVVVSSGPAEENGEQADDTAE